ncbi:hypothetical protein EVA_17853 [gut metagenome]|uniref:Uncharacterized protein n=1 Tax=gut metagenome TaxID=749906 RepID=J9C2L4_9ZZZZ
MADQAQSLISHCRVLPIPDFSPVPVLSLRYCPAVGC